MEKTAEGRERKTRWPPAGRERERGEKMRVYVWGVRTGWRTVKCMCSGQRGRNKEMNKCMQRVVGECM